MVDIRYWIWLSLALCPSFRHTEKIISAFDNAKNVYNANQTQLTNAGLSEELSQRLSNKNVSETNTVYDYCMRNGIGLIAYDSPSYPKRLRNITDPPVLLYCRGNLPDIDDNACIATVGTRSITEYGRREAYTITYDLALAGAVIVSGLARGIDSVCHRACIDAYGQTVAVLGSGIDVIYPKENDVLYSEVASNGAVITEFAPGTRPLKPNFPLRNRIISGLSLGTLVLEADSNSGALITARAALSQGRDLFSLPGKVGELNSIGTNNLIKEGAKMVTCATDVLEEYECLFPHRIRIENIPVSAKRYSTAKPQHQRPSDASVEKFQHKTDSQASTEDKTKESTPDIIPDISVLDGNSVKVLNRMKKQTPVTMDELADEEIPIADVMVAMTFLEIHKFVTALPGGLFVRN